jgi:hypothetical protein
MIDLAPMIDRFREQRAEFRAREDGYDLIVEPARVALRRTGDRWLVVALEALLQLHHAADAQTALVVMCAIADVADERDRADGATD